MRLEHLQYLLEIDKMRSISSTARSLYIGQTTLSSIVKSIEDELGFQIFQRTPRGITTTPAGERMLPLAREIMAKYDEIQSLKSQNFASLAKPVVLLATASIAAGIALRLNKAFLAAAPEATLVFAETPRDQVVPRIFQNEANMGISQLTPDEVMRFQPIAAKYGVELRLLGVDHFYLLVNKTHRLAGREAVTLTELAAENLAIATPFSTAPTGQVMAPLFRGNTRFTAFTNVELVKQAVLEQNMATFLTGCVLAGGNLFDHPDYQVLPLTELEGENRVEIYLIHCNEKYLRRKEKTLLDCITNVVNELGLDAESAACS